MFRKTDKIVAMAGVQALPALGPEGPQCTAKMPLQSNMLFANFRFVRLMGSP